MLRFAGKAKGRRLRSRVKFAQDCIVLAEGPYHDEHWRPHFQPYTYHVLNMMDTAGFRKFRFTGCVQSGKTFIVVINVLWHLFERNETVIFGVPDINETAADKWREELLPLIENSPYLKQFMPRHGKGSQGGTPNAIKFNNGATLRFMAAGGGDHRRSHYTAPVVVKTEVDRYDEASDKSREAPPVEQMEARTEAFGDLAWSYEECTVTTENGRINSELEKSTNTQLGVSCVGCGHVVCPTRDNFHGIEDAVDVDQAANMGAFVCPECGVIWTENDRRSMVTVEKLIPVHRGQAAKMGDDGYAFYEGEITNTDKLGVRWNAFHNLFWSTDKIARDEWNAMYSTHPEEADLKRRQFAWAMPSEPEEFTLVPLSLAALDKRRSEYSLGVVPPNTKWLSCGVDAKMTHLHYVVRAWTQVDDVVEGWAIDIGSIPTQTKELGTRLGLLDALRRFRDDRLLVGYRDQNGNRYVPGWTLIDAGWEERIIWEFMFDCADNGIKGFMPVLGRGQSEPPGLGSYKQPERISESKPWIGEQCYISKNRAYEREFALAGIASQPMHVIANSDAWKSFVRHGYYAPRGKPGALCTFKDVTTAEKAIMREYHRQVLAESMHRKVVPRRGVVDVWRNESKKANHLGDSDYYSCVAGHLCGARVAVRSRVPQDQQQSDKQREPMTMPDGRAFMAVE